MAGTGKQRLLEESIEQVAPDVESVRVVIGWLVHIVVIVGEAQSVIRNWIQVKNRLRDRIDQPLWNLIMEKWLTA